MAGRTFGYSGGLLSFAKIHQSIYDGTLAENWQALVTFQQFLVLADPNGHVDMTLSAIHKRTGIPLHVLLAGMEVLTAPDPFSRTPDNEGRRLVLMDDHRPWGWRVLNYRAYRESRALTNAERQKRFRETKKPVSPPPVPVLTPNPPPAPSVVRNDTVTGVTKSNDVTNRNDSPSVSDSDSPSSVKGSPEGEPVELPPRFPPNLEVAQRMIPVGAAYPPDFVRDTLDKALSRGGRDAKDTPIRSWPHYLAREWTYEQNRVAKDKHFGNKNHAAPPTKTLTDKIFDEMLR